MGTCQSQMTLHSKEIAIIELMNMKESENTSNRMGIVSANYPSDKGLISRISVTQNIQQQKNSPVKTLETELNRQFWKEEIQITGTSTIEDNTEIPHRYDSRSSISFLYLTEMK